MSYSKEIILGAVSMFLRGSNLRISRSKGIIFVDIEQIKKKKYILVKIGLIFLYISKAHSRAGFFCKNNLSVLSDFL